MVQLAIGQNICYMTWLNDGLDSVDSMHDVSSLSYTSCCKQGILVAQGADKLRQTEVDTK